MKAKFIQIHTLTSYAGVLLNRDEAGMAKRLPYGGAMRLRISSQCKKRHMRTADDERSIASLAREIGQEGVRSRIAIEELVIGPLSGKASKDVLEVIGAGIAGKLYGAKGATDVKSRQVLLLGSAEIEWLRSEAQAIAVASADKEDAAQRIAAWAKDETKTLTQLSEGTALTAGLEAALWGRMVTSDKAANTDSAVSVNHSYTVHGEQSELDYFTAVDDLTPSAGGIFDQEITSGLFYGHMVLDIPQLVANTTGVYRKEWDSAIDREIAARVAENLVHLAAKVTPGAKKGSTAPFSPASLIVVEMHDQQPTTFDAAFLDPIDLIDRKEGRPLGRRAADAIAGAIAGFDAMYGKGRVRFQAAMPGYAIQGIETLSLDALGHKISEAVRSATV